MWELSNHPGPGVRAGLFITGDQWSYYNAITALNYLPTNRVYNQEGNLDYYITKSLLMLQWGATMCRHLRVARDLRLLASDGCWDLSVNASDAEPPSGRM
jgi:hypothetical protein